MPPDASSTPLDYPNTGSRIIRTDPAAEDALRHSLAQAMQTVGDNPPNVFAPGTMLSALLAGDVPPHILRPIVRVLARRRMPACLDRLRDWQATRRWPDIHLLRNLALGRPAWQSSCSRHSTIFDPRRDAECGNNADPADNYSFHTARERDPWWVVDLQHPAELDSIVVHNRRDAPERSCGLEIAVSLRQQNWRVVQSIAVDAPPPDAIEAYCASGMPVRFVRVQIPGMAELALREIEVFGVTMTPD